MTNAMIAFFVVFGVFICLWIVTVAIITMLENLFMNKLYRYVRGIILLIRYGLIRLGGANDEEAHRIVLEKWFVKHFLIKEWFCKIIEK